jgi:hypothetical protein
VHISSVYSRDREIEITTSFGKTYHLKLERAISWEEQIEMEEFCRHYVKG